MLRRLRCEAKIELYIITITMNQEDVYWDHYHTMRILATIHGLRDELPYEELKKYVRLCAKGKSHLVSRCYLSSAGKYRGINEQIEHYLKILMLAAIPIFGAIIWWKSCHI